MPYLNNGNNNSNNNNDDDDDDDDDDGGDDEYDDNNNNKVKYVAPYKARTTERVTLRSAKSGRRSSSYKNLNEEEYQGGPPTLAQTYEIGKKIGEGNFSIVKECIHKRTNKRYALKIIEKEKCRGKEHMIQSEVAILQKVKHPNIVELIEEFDSHTELFLVMELVKGGDLFDAISMATKYTEKDACAMIYNLSCALDYLHGNKIVHRDVKPENLLVCDHGDGTKSLKLGDFGLATYTTEELYTVCGTPTYVAPEILSETGYDTKVDVWAAGVIMYILLCGFPPFTSDKNDQEELFESILSGKFEFPSPYWNDVSEQAKDLITNMLIIDPKKRYTAADVTKHDWVTAKNASDRDIHVQIAKEIKSRFNRKPKPSVSSAGIRLVAATALDKQSRYFDGPKHAQLTVPDKERIGTEEDDEIF
ncbi:Serine/threonine-protein kinase dclk1 [Mactra antiquata]